MDPAKLVAIVTGLGGLVTACAGVLLAVRAARDKERKAAKAEIQELSTELTDERHQRLNAERHAYEMALLLARHGINPDEPA